MLKQSKAESPKEPAKAAADAAKPPAESPKAAAPGVGGPKAAAPKAAPEPGVMDSVVDQRLAPLVIVAFSVILLVAGIVVMAKFKGDPDVRKAGTVMLALGAGGFAGAFGFGGLTGKAEVQEASFPFNVGAGLATFLAVLGFFNQDFLKALISRGKDEEKPKADDPPKKDP